MTIASERRGNVMTADAFVARSEIFRRVLDQVHRLARSGTAPILLEGESGTGKTLLARYLHDVSPRSARPFHSVVLSTLDDSLASSDLFGHVAGDLRTHADPGRVISLRAREVPSSWMR